ncbi:unnamed protein product, partial [Brassica napus]
HHRSSKRPLILHRSKPPPFGGKVRTNHRSSTTTVSLSSRVLRDRERIETQHRWKPTTKADNFSVPRSFWIPLSLDPSLPRFLFTGAIETVE